MRHTTWRRLVAAALIVGTGLGGAPSLASAAPVDPVDGFGNGGSVTVGTSAGGTVVLDDGSMIVAAATSGFTERARIVKLTRTGAIDTTFGTNGFADLSDRISATPIDIQRQGDRVLALYFGRPPGARTAQYFIVAVTTAGVLDTRFADNGFLVLRRLTRNDRITAFFVEPSLRIVVLHSSRSSLTMRRFLPSGSPDTSLDGDGVRSSIVGSPPEAQQIVVDRRGRYLTVYGRSIYRILRSGVLDPGFGNGGRVDLAETAPNDVNLMAVAALPDGRILAAGSIGSDSYFLDLHVARLDESGALDREWAGDGTATLALPDQRSAAGVDMVVDRAGRPLLIARAIAGFDTIARLTVTGLPDESLGAGGWSPTLPARGTLVDADRVAAGRIVLTFDAPSAPLRGTIVAVRS
jgi:uncharacterized delta-60 repeat protein